MKVGLFGGTFDPIHLGHLILAERCREEAGLEEVWFLPSYQPPHKSETPSRFEHRCEMVGLAIVGQPAFRLDPIEKELPPPSYTARTLTELKSRHPDAEFRLILGADSLVDLPKWYEPAAILSQAGLIVVPRPGSTMPDANQLATELKLPIEAVSIQTVDCPELAIASREIRARVQAGRSIRFLVPRPVEEFIRERKLYTEQ